MNIEELRSYCLSLPHATEDVKWGHDLCFCIGGKMFCVVPLSGAFSASLKVTVEEFDALAKSTHIIPAPYLARHHWIHIQSPDRFNTKEWQRLVAQSYELVKAKLPKGKRIT